MAIIIVTCGFLVGLMVSCWVVLGVWGRQDMARKPEWSKTWGYWMLILAALGVGILVATVITWK